MCGIVGYIGQSDAFPILIAGLKKLEYRGYDSAGVALETDDKKLNVYKTKGKVSNLEQMAADKDCSGHLGIAHTRWATHGEPSAINAHPHQSMSGDLALVQMVSSKTIRCSETSCRLRVMSLRALPIQRCWCS